MRVSLRWLRDYVDIALSADELAQRLTFSGTEVANIFRVGTEWERVIIGSMEEIDRHPNADHLFVAKVNLGAEQLILVTAATNLKRGDVVPVVPIGGKLSAGQPIQARTFRGIASQGMLCSGDELGISADKENIYVLEPDAPIGQDLRSYLGDEVLDIELTPNRPDCAGIIGIAREVSALTGQPLRLPEVAPPRGVRPASASVRVYVDDPDLCPRYTAGYLEGARVGPSPQWMQRRLHLCGMRPINNLVDVTNYVMLELGQPMHAFDADRLEQETIRVRRASAGETLTTIDGVDREMPADALLIADAARPVGIAGIMGGLHSEISDGTTRLVLESACFDALSIRRTAQALRLATEASRRFDKGLDPELPPIASYRALALMQEVTGGQVAEGLVDSRPTPTERRRVSFTAAGVAALVGQTYGDPQIEEILGHLGFELHRGDGYSALVPTWRADVQGPADIAEEIARIAGYDAIPTTLPTGRLPAPDEEQPLRWEDTLRTALAAAGLQEVITYSLVDPKAVSRLDVRSPFPDVAPDADTIGIANPMSVEHSRLRTTLLPSLLSTVAANLRYQARVLIFEIARAFLPPLEPLPKEARRLAIAIAGRRSPPGWGSEAEPLDFYDLKAAVEATFRALGVSSPVVIHAQEPWLHPGRSAGVQTASGTRVGTMGQVHPQVAERFGIEKLEVYAAELDLDVLTSLARDEVRVEALPRYPAVERDLAIVVDDAISHLDIAGAIKEAGGPFLQSVELFDLYRGAPIPVGKRSLAYSLTFRASDRTLAEEEVLSALESIQRQLSSRFSASLRGPAPRRVKSEE